jgi:hypothetical protein
MTKLQEILTELDAVVGRRTEKDEAIGLIIKALHEIASDHHELHSKIGGAPFTPSNVHDGLKGGVS